MADRSEHLFGNRFLTLECKLRHCLGRRHPGGFVYFVVVIGNITAHILHQKEVDELVISYSLTIACCLVPVFDFLEKLHDLSVETRFLANLTHSRGFRSFAFVYQTFRELPPRRGTNGNERYLGDGPSSANHDSACGDLGLGFWFRSGHHDAQLESNDVVSLGL